MEIFFVFGFFDVDIGYLSNIPVRAISDYSMALLVKHYTDKKDEADEAKVKCNFRLDTADDLDLIHLSYPQVILSLSVYLLHIKWNLLSAT